VTPGGRRPPGTAPRGYRDFHMKQLLCLCLMLSACLPVPGAPGSIILLNGTSSAGKSSLAAVLVARFTSPCAVVSYDDFHRAYRGPRASFLTEFYRHARKVSDAGTNVIIDTVEFDRDADRYCAVLNCSNVVRTVVYCPLPAIHKRVDRRNASDDPYDHRGVLLAFQQFVEMYRPQSAPGELVVEKTTTAALRSALEEAGRKADNPARYEALRREFVRVFDIDRDRELVLVPRGRYDLVLNTRAAKKAENAGRVLTLLEQRGRSH